MKILNTLKARLVLAFGLSMLLIGTLTSVYLDRVFTEKLRTDKLQNLQNLSTAAAALISENLRERQREISLLAEAPYLQVGSVNTQELQTVFDKIQRSYKQYAWIGYADASGHVLASTNGLLVGANVTERPWFKHGKSGPFVGDLHDALLLSEYLPKVNDGSPARFIDFAAPVFDHKGQLRGVLAAHAYWAWANEAIGVLSTNKMVSDDIQVFIVGKDGGIIYPSSLGNGTKVPLGVLEKGLSIETWGDDETYASAMAAVPDQLTKFQLEWKIVTLQPLESVLKDVRVLHRILLFALLGAAIVLVGLMVWLAGRLSRPVEQLSLFAKRIEAGQEGAVLELGQQPLEIQQTIDSVSKIAQVLIERKQALADANRDLEQKILDRTAELQEKGDHLEEQRLLLESIIDAFPYGVVVYDEKQVLQQCNTAFFSKLKISESSVVRGKTHFSELVRIFYERGDYGYSQPVESLVLHFVGLMKRKERVTIERQQADGSHIEMRAFPISGDWIVMTYQDTTVRRREQQVLEEAQTRLLLANDSAGVGVWDFDVQSGVVTWDDQIYRLFGYAVGSVEPDYNRWANALHPDDRQRVQDEFGICLQTGNDFNSEFRMYWPDGSMHYMRGFGRCRKDASGKILSVIGTNFDVTPIRQAAQDLSVALRNAEDAAISKGLFLANMSHEIRTPLAAVLGLLQVLSQTPLTESQFDTVEKIEGAAKSLLGLLNDILDFSKIDAGKLDIEQQPFDLDQLLRELSVVLAAYVGNKPVEVLYDLDPGLPLTVIGDQLRIKQILVNLAGNGIKFTEAGQVVISARARKALDTGSDLTLIRFSVTDSGIGIAPENLPKLFSSFSQAEGSTSRKFGGTGLGLAICKRLVELMGGAIGVESQLGSGTTFWLEIPLPRVIGTRVAATLDSELGKTVHKVLLVDDNPVAARLISQTIQSFGWTVDVASTGQDAIEMVTSTLQEDALPYSLVYLDWQLKGVDGWETLRRIHSALDTAGRAHPRYIMLSANGRDNLGLRTLEEQALLSDFLVKPITPSMLYNASLRSADVRSTTRRNLRTNDRELSGIRILVVEDNAINQHVAEELLSNKGAIVSIAPNGREGVNSIISAQHPYDIVLMDIQMPVMDGYAATEYVRRELHLSPETLPIVGLTANALSTDKDKCLQAGMNDHIGKPFDLGQLVSTVLRLTKNSPSSKANGLPVISALVEKKFDESTIAAEFDLPGALRRLGGMHALYARSAKDFITAMPQYMDKLNNAASLGDKDSAAVVLHTVKGIAGTLGLSKLYLMLANLESELKRNTDTLKFKESLDDLSVTARGAVTWLTETIEEMSAIGTSIQGTIMTQSNSAEIVSALRRLVPLLETGDLTALEEFAGARQVLQALPDDVFTKLENAIQDLELDEALRICRQIV